MLEVSHLLEDHFTPLILLSDISYKPCNGLENTAYESILIYILSQDRRTVSSCLSVTSLTIDPLINDLHLCYDLSFSLRQVVPVSRESTGASLAK